MNLKFSQIFRIYLTISLTSLLTINELHLFY